MFARLRIGLLLLVVLATLPAQADVRPHALVSDGMVLQQEKPARLWGTAAAGEKVTVEFREQTVTTVTSSDGRWKLELTATTAGGPFPLVIRGTNELRFKEVYVGEVWVCSGQSNMGWPVATRPGSKELQGTENPMIRLFTVPQRLSDDPETELSREQPGSGRWQACGPESLVGFSAVAYYFGRELAETRKVPIGLIHASYGGSSIEQWIERDALAATKRKLPSPPPSMGDRVRAASPKTSKLYNGMIAPLVPFGIRGVIWYQGEADVGQAGSYEKLFTGLIENWRRVWNRGPFPFLFVQIAPYGKIAPTDAQTVSHSADLRDAQLRVSLTVENTGMAVVTDWGHETDIHVKQKKPVGHRLALLARSLVYGETKLECFGPTLKEAKFAGNKVILSFDHVAGGLAAKSMVLEDFSTDPRTGNGGALHVVEKVTLEPIPLVGFKLVGQDGKYVSADAVIHGDTVVLSSPDAAEPIGVDYGRADYPTGNLFNGAGLPASPFRYRPADK